MKFLRAVLRIFKLGTSVPFDRIARKHNRECVKALAAEQEAYRVVLARAWEMDSLLFCPTETRTQLHRARVNHAKARNELLDLIENR